MNGRPHPGATDLVRDVVDGYLAEDDAMLGARDRAARPVSYTHLTLPTTERV